MLAIPKNAAVVAFIGLGALVLVVAAVLSAPRRLSGAVLSVILVIGGVAVLTAGVVGASTGEREFEAHHEDQTKKTSNAVADKANVAAAVTMTGSTLTPDQLELPRTTPVNLLFENHDTVPRQLVIEAGQQPKLQPDGQPAKDANGNAILEPIRFTSDYLGQDKAA